MSIRRINVTMAVVLSFVATPVLAVSVPTSEKFTIDAANWADSSGLAPLSHMSNGGPDGSAYATTTFTFNSGGGAGGTSAVLFRAQDEFNSSGHAFEGNWISDKITKLTAQVRHNAPQPLNYFSRFSGPDNFPGGTAIQFAPVLPNVWTTLTFNISPTSPQFVTFEGMNFSSVFSDVGHIQLGVSIPAALAADMTAYKYDLDNVIATPEPTAVCLAALALGWVAIIRRRPC
jgi:hypothetical protein